MTELAKKYGVRRKTISAMLNRHGFELRVMHTISEQEIDRAVDLYATGMSTRQVGEQLGCDAETIRTHLKRRGVQMRQAGRPRKHPAAPED
jgi:uncharacterized protein YjcR